nr:immunoglobulin heavy chain junction region [Macaca mulatta]MOW91942.1 immunoglobulin heavy chain junction region [Macaca mulatta]
CARTNSNFDYW